MNALYLFAAAAGVPLVVWFLLSGGDDGSDSGEGAGVGGVMLRLLPLSTIALAMATFGIAGLVLGAVGTGAGTTLLGAGGAAGLAAVLNSTVFAYLRRSESGGSLEDGDLVGRAGRVVLPLGTEQRGRISVTVGGQQRYLSARATSEVGVGQLEVGAPVLVVAIHDGVAIVTRLDPELE